MSSGVSDITPHARGARTCQAVHDGWHLRAEAKTLREGGAYENRSLT
jgi:hypothetical protein